MQLETALRLSALAMQLSNVVKPLVLRATNVPKRTANTTSATSARTPSRPARSEPGRAVPGGASPAGSAPQVVAIARSTSIRAARRAGTSAASTPISAAMIT